MGEQKRLEKIEENVFFFPIVRAYRYEEKDWYSEKPWDGRGRTEGKKKEGIWCKLTVWVQSCDTAARSAYERGGQGGSVTRDNNLHHDFSAHSIRTTGLKKKKTKNKKIVNGARRFLQLRTIMNPLKRSSMYLDSSIYVRLKKLSKIHRSITWPFFVVPRH